MTCIKSDTALVARSPRSNRCKGRGALLAGLLVLALTGREARAEQVPSRMFLGGDVRWNAFDNSGGKLAAAIPTVGWGQVLGPRWVGLELLFKGAWGFSKFYAEPTALLGVRLLWDNFAVYCRYGVGTYLLNQVSFVQEAGLDGTIPFASDWGARIGVGIQHRQPVEVLGFSTDRQWLTPSGGLVLSVALVLPPSQTSKNAD